MKWKTIIAVGPLLLLAGVFYSQLALAEDWSVTPGQTLYLSGTDAPQPEYVEDDPTYGHCAHYGQSSNSYAEIGLLCLAPLSGLADSGYVVGAWIFPIIVTGPTERTIGSTLAVEMDIKGYLITEGISVNAGIRIQMDVFDDSDKLIATKVIADEECASYAVFDPCIETHSGQYGEYLNVTLKRGNAYKVVVSAHSWVSVSALGSAESIFYDDGTTNGWVEFKSLTLTLEDDIAGMIEALGKQVQLVQDKVDTLDSLEDHIHEDLHRFSKLPKTELESGN